MAPSRDRHWIERQHLLTEELRGYLRNGGRFDFHGLSDPTALIHKSRIQGAALELTRSAMCCCWPTGQPSGGRLRCIHRSPSRPNGRRYAGFRKTLQTSRRCCATSATRFCPTARWTTALRPSWRAFAATSSDSGAPFRNRCSRTLRRLSDGGAVQDELITIRGERFVIPVKVEQRRRVQGVAHGASSSGQTVFIEPLETIEQNNELVRLHDEEQAEIHRILLEMTARIGEQAEAWKQR